MASNSSSAKSQSANVKNINEAFAKIDEKIDAMKSEDVSLEEAFAEFQEGMKLVQFAESAIDKIEKEVKVITESGEEDDSF